jgi:hypothetical protein
MVTIAIAIATVHVIMLLLAEDNLESIIQLLLIDCAIAILIHLPYRFLRVLLCHSSLDAQCFKQIIKEVGELLLI